MLTASLTALCSILLAYQTQSIEAAMLIGLGWTGALICIEDDLPKIDPNPSKFSLIAGILVLAFCLWRTYIIFHMDVTVYVLPVLQGLGLVFVLIPIKKIIDFKNSLACLMTPMIAIILNKLISIPVLSEVTARVTQGVLLLFGQVATVIGSEVWVRGGGVHIAGPCSGIESVKLLVVIGIIFLLAFPLPDRRSRAVFALLAPVAAVIGNAFRIGCLALINASELADRKALFDFFHEEHGSLVFSLITASLFSWIYLGALDFQLTQQERRHAA